MGKTVFELEAVLKLNDQAFQQGVEAAKGKSSSFKDHLLANLASGAITKAFDTIVGGFTKIANVINDHVTPAVSRLDTLNSYGKTMTALGFSTEEASDSVQKLSGAIDGLPTTLDGIVNWQQQFTALTDDISGATDLTIALNNATLAAGKGQEAANNAMGNWYGIIAAGKPDAQHWQSLYSAMPAQMNQIAEAVLGAGAKSDDLFAAWKEGAVTTEDVTNALLKLNSEGLDGVASFADQAQVGAQTIETAYGNLDTAISRNVANVIDVLNGDATQGGGRIVQLLLNVKALINNIGSTITGFVKAHAPEIDKIMEALGAIFKGEDIAGNVKTVLENVGTVIKDLFGKVKDFLENNKDSIIETIKSIFGSFIDTLVSLLPILIPIAVAAIGAIVGSLIENLPMIINGAVQVILALVSGLLDSLPTLIPAVLDAIILIVNTIVDNLGFIIDAALQILIALAQGLIDALPTLAAAVPRITGKIIAVIIQHLPEIIMAAIQIISAICQGLFAALPDIAMSVFTIMLTIKEELDKGAKEFVGNAKKWGEDMVSNLIAGIKKMWSKFTGAIKDLAGFIKDNLGFSEPKMGPLSNFHTYAPDMIDLFTSGLYSNEDKLRDAFADVFQMPDPDVTPAPGGGVSGSVATYAAANGVLTVREPINIYVGSKKISQQIVTVEAYNDLISGGR